MIATNRRHLHLRSGPPPARRRRTYPRSNRFFVFQGIHGLHTWAGPDVLVIHRMAPWASLSAFSVLARHEGVESKRTYSPSPLRALVSSNYSKDKHHHHHQLRNRISYKPWGLALWPGFDAGPIQHDSQVRTNQEALCAALQPYDHSWQALR